MTLLRFCLEPKHSASHGSFTFGLWTWLAVIGILSPPAHAGLIDNFSLVTNYVLLSPIDWTTVVTSPCSGTFCGGFTYSASTGQLVITGPNDGSGNPGTADFFTTASSSGSVTFDFSYASADPWPTFDCAGYLLAGTSTSACNVYPPDNVFTMLADTDGQAGAGITFSIAAGQVFGFSVQTADNTGEPGILTISNIQFSAQTSDPPGIPEPATFVIALPALIAIVLWKRKSGAAVRRETV